MFFSLTPSPRQILTPCIGICELDPAGICRGCHRTIDEIAGWSTLAEAERLRIMSEVLPIRAVQDTST